MKYLVLFFGLFIAIGANAQQVEKAFTSPDTVTATTSYFPLGAKIRDYAGAIVFSGSKVDLTDSLSVLVIQGANSSDFSDAADMTGNGVIENTTTDGAFQLSIVSPLYLYYRLKATAAAGDSVELSDLKGVYKKQ